jgi:two-component system, cell cycle sensor histidine kinase and response regulator CckA
MSRATILVVDDEPQIRGLIRDVLANESYRVLEAGDGLQAIEICEQEGVNIDLLLTDIVMPKLDGIELTRRICAKLPQTQVIFMSGKCDTGMVEREVQQRGFGFIKKPFAIDKLLETIRRALEAERKSPAKSGSSAAAASRTA